MGVRVLLGEVERSGMEVQSLPLKEGVFLVTRH